MTAAVLRRALAALAAACVAALPARAAAQAQPQPQPQPPAAAAPTPPVIVRVESAPPSVSPEAVRDAIGRELGAPVVAPEAAPAAPRGVITVAVDAANRVTVRFRDAAGHELVRVVSIPPAPGELVGTVAVLAGNLARNEADELLATLPPPPPPPAPPPPPPPPVAPPRPRVAPQPPLVLAPFAFSLVPVLATDGLAGGTRTHVAALHLIAGYSGGLDGVEVSAAVNVERNYSRGLQVAGAANVVGGDATGAQAAGAANVVAGAARGLQAAGALNVGARGLAGVAVAGAANVHTGRVAGMQVAGALNLARGALAGVQAAGGANVALGPAVGVQVAGALNLARDAIGLQVAGGANVATGTVTGAQVGVFNYAGQLRGLQVGVVNVSGGGRGVALGLFNFVRGEPLHVEVTASTLLALGVALRHGSRYLRNVYSVTVAPFGADVRWMLGLGLGVHLPLGRVEGDIDAVVHQVNRGAAWPAGLHLLTQLRATVLVPLAPRLAVMAGAALNWLVSTDARDADLVFGPALRTGNDAGRLFQALWPSLHVGLRI